MRVGDYTASIVVDEKELEEYKVTLDLSTTAATCWVASEVGKKFTVRWKCHSKTHLMDHRGRVVLDGTDCGAIAVSRDQLEPNNTTDFSSIVCGTMERDFMFSNLQLTDDEALLGRSVSTNFGEILLRIEHGEKGSSHPDMTELPSLLDHSNKRHERTVKKLSSHCVGFGQQRSIPRESICDFTPNNTPPITFTFKYRPIEILQANGVAPRPEPVSKEATSENDTTAVFDRIHLLENELKRLRDQVSGETQEPKAKRIKRENDVKPIISGEVIDLT